MNIYKANGDILIADVPILEAAKHVQELSKSDYVKLSWADIKSVTLPIGAYIIPFSDGVKYTILKEYKPTMKDEVEYTYEPEFQHPVMILGYVPCILRTSSTTGESVDETDWSYTGSLTDIATKVVDIINEQTGKSFVYSFITGSEVLASATVTFGSVDILSALSSIATAFETEYHVDWDAMTVYFGDIFLGTEETLEEGVNTGVASVSASSESLVNYYVVRGGTRNITTQTATGDNVETNTRLAIPDIDLRTDKVNEPALKRVLIFDDVYPHLDLYVYDVRVRTRRLKDDEGNYVVAEYNPDGTVKTYQKYGIYYIRLAYYDKTTGLWTDFAAPKSTIVSGKKLMASFESNENNGHSALAGREFAMTYHDTAETIAASADIEDSGIEIKAGDYEINFETEDDLRIPDINTLQPWGESEPSTDCDKVVLYNIVMSSAYISTAQAELLAEANKEIARLSSDLNNYTLKLYPEIAQNALSIGQVINYKAISGYTLRTRVIKLETNLDYSNVVTVTIGNTEIKGRTQTLKDDVQSVNDKVATISSVYSNNTTNIAWLLNIVNSVKETVSAADNKYLRKDKDDETTHKLTVGSAEVKGSTTIDGKIASDSYVAGAPTSGSGWAIDRDGNIEGESIKVRGFMEVPEIRFNRASVVAGTTIQSPCSGIIKAVVPNSSDTGGIATLELGDDDIAGSIAEGDFCWGYWHDTTTPANNAAADSDDHSGNITYGGFCTVYFYIQKIYTADYVMTDAEKAIFNELGVLDAEGKLPNNSTVFQYELRPDTNADDTLKYPNHPYVGMHFGGRGNNKDASRQGFTVLTPSYTATYQLVTGWNWSNMGKYIVRVSGRLDGFESLVNKATGTWSNEFGTIDTNFYLRGEVQKVSNNTYYLYITQSSNGIIESGDTETVTFVIRDNQFDDYTTAFRLYINDTEVTISESGTFSVSYAFSDLTADINRYTVKAVSKDKIGGHWDWDTQGNKTWVDGEYLTLTDTFVIRKAYNTYLTLTTSVDNDPFIDNTEPKTITCTVMDSNGVDRTADITKWSIVRDTAFSKEGEAKEKAEAADIVWGQRSKAVNFAGTIDIYWSDDTEINDIDLDNATTKFKITAVIGSDTLTTTINI